MNFWEESIFIFISNYLYTKSPLSISMSYLTKLNLQPKYNKSLVPICCSSRESCFDLAAALTCDFYALGRLAIPLLR